MSANYIYAIAITDPSEPEPTWAISVQPKKANKLFSHNSPTQPSSAAAESAHYGVATATISDVAKSATIIEKKVEDVLFQITHDSTRDSPEAWLRDAVNGLQSAELVAYFDMAGFLDFATQTLEAQLQRSERGTVEADYLADMKRADSVVDMDRTSSNESEGKKRSKFGFLTKLRSRETRSDG
ncbi:hypothetical protein H2203_006021 [Taxawa tesnikishii (nom. ined.)]|nr:hypothetical protein H2203_006021 [Dothideales sp. JES 119]